MSIAPDNQPRPLAAIFSFSGTELSADERDLFIQANPLGFILFSRNIENPVQLKRLTDDLKAALGRDCPILIDQEGGRVQRLKAPHWRNAPPMKNFGDAAQKDKAHALEDLRYTILRQAEELSACGISVNCAPVLDVLCSETHAAIGDRAFSNDPELVSALGLCACETFLEAGITPVIKHMPGHGRAALDSHADLPVIAADKKALERDFTPFRAAAKNPAIWGMTAHVIYDALDPDNPASLSRAVIQDTIRGDIGFTGFLLSDDLSMGALEGQGSITQRALKAIEAGNDAALYCAGKPAEMDELAACLPGLNVRHTG
jgi:beta-N-acetylhexosaminidase